MNLLELVEEEQRLNELLSENRKKQKAIHIDNFINKYGVNIGDTIEFMDGREKVIGKIFKFDYSGVKVNYPVVNPFKKDGNISKIEKRVWYSNFDTMKIIKSVKY